MLTVGTTRSAGFSIAGAKNAALGPSAKYSNQPDESTTFTPGPAHASRSCRYLGGGLFDVSSFFDLYFDLTITDIDAVNDFGGRADGAVLTYQNAGALHFTTSYQATFNANTPNFALFPPPETAPYVGSFALPLGADFNRNGTDDKLTLDLALTLLDANRTFITLPDGTVIDNLDVSMSFGGGVSDVDDPPFGPLTLTGPTAVVSQVVGSVPEPSSMLLLGLGIAAGAVRRARRRG
jgi:hypothetical protein